MNDEITARWLESVKRRTRRSDETRWRQGATRIGISFEAYRAKVKAGLKWCSYQNHGWRLRKEFGPHAGKPEGLSPICRSCDRKAALIRSRAKRKAS
jgi:hypothetical protein